ncbi:hypothetical protein [Aliikangiella sp. G2MR2-5]|uniref:hypothetical protein n=1 Tax=Aliikangiella sp. G2MR2-5 TaxID=2788943 RepID=UPI001AEEE1D6|nr:hypothetical protein [Aliikangiella sp. G2MR2-5]
MVTNHKKVNLKSRLDCYFDDVGTFALFIDHECRIDYLLNAVDEPAEKVNIDLIEKGVQYLEFHLKDRNKGTPIFARVIRDDNNCLIVTGVSSKAISDRTKSLWFDSEK